MAILDGGQLRTKGLWHACIMKGRYWDLLNISSLPIWWLGSWLKEMDDVDEYEYLEPGVSVDQNLEVQHVGSP